MARPRPAPPALCLALLLCLAVAQDEASAFAPASLFPPAPATPLRNFQKLLPAAQTWTDLAVFTALLTQLTKLGVLPPLPNDGTPFTVFAPTNEAFLKFLAPAPPAPQTFVDTDFLFDTLARLIAATEDDATPPAIVSALVGVVRYHIVPGAGTEAELRAAGKVDTLRARSQLDVSAFPSIVDAQNRTSTRYGRSLKVGDNGLLATIDAVLAPIDATPVVDFLFPDNNLPTPPPAPHSLPGIPPTFQRFRFPAYAVGGPPRATPLPAAPYTYALGNYAGFLSARADLQIFTALVGSIPDLARAVLAFNRNVHPLIPNDAAFLKLLMATGVPEYRVLANRLTNDPFNAALLTETVKMLAAVVAALPGPPTVSGIVTYHVLDGGADLVSRAGAQNTLAEGALLSIGNLGSQFFVVDGDASRTDPRVIVSLPTGSGYVSVIDGVLLNLNLRDALSALGPEAIAALPRPDLPEPTEEPVPSEGPTKTPTPGTGTGVGPVADAVPSASEEESEPSITPETADSESGTAPADGAEEEDDDGVCFPADARVHKADGTTVAMSDLRPGDRVLTHPADKTGSPVFLFSHRAHDATTEVVRVETASGHVVRATKGHYLYVNGRLRAFGAVRVGDRVHTLSGDSIITRTSRVVARGLFAPHALRANLVVDGVWVSGYSTAVRPRVAEALLAPLRFVSRRFGVTEPIGDMLYNGADHLLRFIPRGAQAY